MNSTRTVITGLGLVSPFGFTQEALAEGLYAGKNAVLPLPQESFPELFNELAEIIRFAAPCTQFTGDIDDFAMEDKNLKRTIRKSLKILCRETQMAIAATQRALTDAGLDFHGEPQKNVGLMYGSDYMLSDPRLTEAAFRTSMDGEGVFHSEKIGANGVASVMPLWLLTWLPNMPACHITILNQFIGPNNSLTLNEASANATLAYAHNTIERGIADVMVTGATGTRLQNIRTFQVAINEKLADPSVPPELASRPFDRARTGQVLGEGAATLILESLEHAKQRGAKVYAEYLAACDTMAGKHNKDDLTKPLLVPDHKAAFINVMRRTLAMAGKTPDQVGFLVAHGLGDPDIDRAEAEAIDEVFGSRSTPLPVVAAKGTFGNLGAGAGAIELIAGITALNRGTLFPTRNFEAFDEGTNYRFRVVTDSETPAGDCFLHISTCGPTAQTSAALIGKCA